MPYGGKETTMGRWTRVKGSYSQMVFWGFRATCQNGHEFGSANTPKRIAAKVGRNQCPVCGDVVPTARLVSVRHRM